MSWEELDFILKNEKYYRQVLNTHFQENFIGDDLGVQNNSYGNNKEKSLVNKLEDKEYKKALKVVGIIDKFFETKSDIYIHIFRMKYRMDLSIPQIARQIHYSEATVKKKLRIIRKYFIEYLK